MDIKKRIKSKLRLLTALKCAQPIVIFQSDDWGMVRSPENKSLIPKFGEPKIWAYDQLETVAELESLYKILSGYKDAHGNHPFIEANFVVSNPDFSATKANGYSSIILKSISDYPELIDTWNEGIAKRVFLPQYHGRLHFNYNKMVELLQNDAKSKAIFDLRIHGGLNNYKEFGWTLHSEYQKWEDGSEMPYNQLLHWIRTGMEDFKNAFGYYPQSTIAPQYVFTPTTAKAFVEAGLKIVQGTNMQMYKKNNKRIARNIPTGSSYYKGLIALGRNIKFEPARGHTEWKYAAVMKKCENLIQRKVPIIIDSHRINYVGKFAEEGRDELNKLIRFLLKSGCLFLSATEFGEAIKNKGVYQEFGTQKTRKLKWMNNTFISKTVRNHLN